MNGVDSSTCASSKEPSIACCKLDRKKLIDSIPLSETRFPSVNNEVFYLFNRSLHLQLDEEDDLEGKDEIYSHLLSSVLTYNVGITHHLAGLQKGDSQLLTRALEFYSLVYATLTEQSDWLRKFQSSLDFCLLALANNIGHIHAYFHCFTKAGYCRDDISCRLLAISRSSLLPDFGSLVSPEEYRVLYLNVHFFRESELAYAAAA